MMHVYIHINQLYNFMILKEPVQLEINCLDSNHVELYLPINKIIYKEYSQYATIELKTVSKSLKEVFRWKRKKNK